MAEQFDPLFEPADFLMMTPTLNWSSCTRKSIAEAQRTSGKASTTRSIDKDLYWCRIPENSWSRTTRRTTTTSRKLLRWISKNLRWKRMYLLLRADQRSKQNHKDVFLPAHPQKLYLLGKELGPILNHKIIRPSIIQCRSNWSFFFVMVIYLEKMVERLNSGDWKIIFGTNLCTLNIGLMKCGRVPWQEAEETRKDFNIVLILQDKKFFTSELFKVIQDAVS